VVSVCASPWPYVQCCSGRVCVIIQKKYIPLLLYLFYCLHIVYIVPEKKPEKKESVPPFFVSTKLHVGTTHT